MKYQFALILASAIRTAFSAAITNNPDKATIESLLSNPYLLSKSSKTILSHYAGNVHRRSPQAREDGGLLNSLLSTIGLASRNVPESSVPETQSEAPKYWSEAKRTKVRYGPFRIPPTSERNFQSELLGVQGMSTSFTPGAMKPCTDCTLLTLEADLEYADGKPAANSNGAWFHHAVLLNTGPGVMEPNCGRGSVENIFMSGNERTTGGFALPNSTVKSGYSLSKDHYFILNTELMNMDNNEKYVWMTITYEYLDGLHPEYKQGKTIWQSIGTDLRCGGQISPWGETNLTRLQQPKSKIFSEHSQPWIVPKDGVLLSTGGHLHDGKSTRLNVECLAKAEAGGVSLDVYYADKVVCSSTPEYVKSDGHSHGMGAKRRRQAVKGGEQSNNEIDHIGHQGVCLFPEGRTIKQGERMFIQADYDFEKHPGMKNKNGELDEVMGISGTLVAF